MQPQNQIHSNLLIKLYLLILLSEVLIFSSCIHEEPGICEDKQQMIQVQILPQWDSQVQLPKGMRVLFYSLDTHKYVQDNFSAQGGEAEIRTGNYQFIIYNNDSEKIRIRNTENYESAEAYTSKISRPSYNSPVNDEETYGQPDIFWLDRIESFKVSSKSSVVRFYPQQVVFFYNGRVEVDGMEDVQEVRGAITGILGSVKLYTGKTNKPSTLFFDAFKEKQDIVFSFRSFGIYNQGVTPVKQYLVLEFLLPNGIVQRNIDISEQMENLLQGGYVRVKDKITIPPDTTGTDNGFNANVEDWKEIIYPIEI